MKDKNKPGFVIVCERYDSKPIYVCRAGKNIGWTVEKACAKTFPKREAVGIAGALLNLTKGSFGYRIEL
jgi:hypothetical protein